MKPYQILLILLSIGSRERPGDFESFIEIRFVPVPSGLLLLSSGCCFLVGAKRGNRYLRHFRTAP